MFCDETEIKIEAGKGGDGIISFRKEKYVPKGGPNGGNGGKGGDVIFKTNENLNSLVHLHTKKFFKAKEGSKGGNNNKAGASGEDIILEVPVGTQIFDFESNDLIVDLNEKNISAIIAVGGRGGYGNAHFKSSVRQAPKFAELGEPGESKQIRLELKLVADAGIMGLPSAGKSTLISVVSDAKPKIGNYPFTTLIPNLGVAKIGNRDSLVLCDIPGLIEGAHEGKGLGHKFLRHIARNLVLIHLISAESEDPIKDIKIINKELLKFDKELAKKPYVIAISKIDLADKAKAEDIFNKIKKSFKKTQIYKISAVTNIGTKELIYDIFNMVNIEKEKIKIIQPDKDHVLLRPHLDEKFSKRFEIEKQKNGQFLIIGPRIEQIAIMTDFTNNEATFRLRDVMRKMGIERELIKIGAKRGTKIIFKRGLKTIDFLPEIIKN